MHVLISKPSLLNPGEGDGEVGTIAFCQTSKPSPSVKHQNRRLGGRGGRIAQSPEPSRRLLQVLEDRAEHSLRHPRPRWQHCVGLQLHANTDNGAACGEAAQKYLAEVPDLHTESARAAAGHTLETVQSSIFTKLVQSSILITEDQSERTTHIQVMNYILDSFRNFK